MPRLARGYDHSPEAAGRPLRSVDVDPDVRAARDSNDPIYVGVGGPAGPGIESEPGCRVIAGLGWRGAIVARGARNLQADLAAGALDANVDLASAATSLQQHSIGQRRD